MVTQDEIMKLLKNWRNNFQIGEMLFRLKAERDAFEGLAYKYFTLARINGDPESKKTSAEDLFAVHAEALKLLTPTEGRL